jgi:hypothetical protein
VGEIAACTESNGGKGSAPQAARKFPWGSVGTPHAEELFAMSRRKRPSIRPISKTPESIDLVLGSAPRTSLAQVESDWDRLLAEFLPPESKRVLF